MSLPGLASRYDYPAFIVNLKPPFKNNFAFFVFTILVEFFCLLNKMQKV